jgi:hypothetical protein
MSSAQPSEIESGRAGQLLMGSSTDSQFEGWFDELTIFREAVPTQLIQELSK